LYIVGRNTLLKLGVNDTEVVCKETCRPEVANDPGKDKNKIVLHNVETASDEMGLNH
jgi:hypothetical protein